MSESEYSTVQKKEQNFSDIPNLNIILEHPLNFCVSLNWEQLHTLQELQYPGTSTLKRNVLVASYPDRADAVTHKHDFFEILYVYSGTCTHYVEKNFTPLHEGDCCILPPGISHCLVDTENAQIGLVLIHPEALKSLFALLSTSQDSLSCFLRDIFCKQKLDYYLLFHTENNPILCESLFALKDEMLCNDEYSDRLALTKLSVFLLNISRTCQYTERSSHRAVANQDQQILSMIYEQYATITLAQLAETLHYSIPYCSKYLKKNMGCTFSELIQKVRFQQARNLLANSSLPVNQIGKNIGYETPENFFRAFKKVYGMTPSQYRKINKVQEKNSEA